MSSENKARRALARQLSRAKDRRRRRHLGHRRQINNEGLSKEEFQKKFPDQPLKLWYSQKRLIGSITFEDDLEPTIPENNPFLPGH